MGARGPARTPTAILKARGSRLAGQREQAEPTLGTEAPTCPSWLPAEAKAEWKRQIKHLVAAGVVQTVDRAALTVYCEAWAEYAAAVAELAEAGLTIKTVKGAVIQSPMVGIRNRAAERLVKLAQQFGFTPAARSRVQVGKKEEGKKQDGKARFFFAG